MTVGGTTGTTTRTALPQESGPASATGIETGRSLPTWAVRWWPAAWGAVLGATLFLLARRALPDDALITLAFARSVVSQGCLCLTDGVSVNTMTSPLHLALLVGPVWAGIPPFVAVALLLMVELAVVAWCLHRLAGPTAALLGPALLATSPVFGSAVGMETFLAAAIAVALLTAAAEDRTVVAGVLCAAAVLTRPDLVFVAVAVVGVLAAAGRRRLLLALPLGAVIILPWIAISWWRLGSAWPHTVAIKGTGEGWFGGTFLWNGVPGYFWPAFPGAAAATVATLLAGLVALAVAVHSRSWPAVASAAGGIASLAALTATAAPPTAYYAGPAIAGLGLAAVLVAAQWRPARVTVVALVGAALGVAAAHGPLWAEGLAPVRQNWATNDQYAAIAAGLPRDGVVLSTTEIGALAYFCQDHGCRVTDVVLSDPGYIDERVASWRARHPWAEANYAHYRPGRHLPWRYRLDFGPPPGGVRAGDWPITRAPGMHQVARLARLGAAGQPPARVR